MLNHLLLFLLQSLTEALKEHVCRYTWNMESIKKETGPALPGVNTMKHYSRRIRFQWWSVFTATLRPPLTPSLNLICSVVQPCILSINFIFCPLSQLLLLQCKKNNTVNYVFFFFCSHPCPPFSPQYVWSISHHISCFPSLHLSSRLLFPLLPLCLSINRGPICSHTSRTSFQFISWDKS